MKLRLLIYVILTFVFIGQVYANTNGLILDSNIPNENVKDEKFFENADKQDLLSVIQHQQQDLNKLENDYQSQSLDLKKLQEDYLDLKQNLAVQDKSDELTTFSSWASILLTSVAVIVTVLGVIIAIISFYGFKSIGKQAEKAAESAIQEKLDGIAIAEFEKLVNEGRLTASIHNAVAAFLRNERQNQDVNVYPELEGDLQNED